MSITLGTSGSIVLDSGSNLIGQVELSDGTNIIGTPAHPLAVDGSAVTQPVSGTVAISGSIAVTGTFWQTTQPVSIAATVATQQTPGTSGGLSTHVEQAITTSASVKSSAGQVYGYRIFNPNTSTVFVFWYNTTSAPTIGSSTNLIDVIGIPAGAAANIEGSNGVAYSIGIYLAVSTAVSSSTAPSTGLVVTTLYK